MPFVGRTELRRRLQQSHWLLEAWSVVHSTDTHTSEGTTTTWAVTASGSPAEHTGGRFSSARYQAREQDIGGAVAAVGSWTITLPHTTVVYPDDRVIKGVALATGTAVEWDEGYRAFDVLGTATDATDETVTLVSAVEVT